MPKYKLDKRQVSRQDTTSPKNIIKGGGSSTQPSKGWVGASRSILPINAAMYMQDLIGNKTPLTTSDMKDSEMKVLRQAARNSKVRTQSNGGNTSYRDLNDSDYPKSTVKENLEGYLRSPVRKMQTTIGGATLRQKGANTKLTDTFDYNTSDSNQPVSEMTAYDALRAIGGNFGSKEGQGTPVDIDLGNLKRPTKYETYMKGTKRVKKAVNGLQDIAVPEQGSYSNVLSSASSFAGAGSQFGLVGGIAGGVLGAGLGFLQKGKQDALNKSALAINRDNKMNRAYAGYEDSINQAPQRFKKGTKMIEIEGKKTPEIHTDKNFNVKNLGTTPHSKGGDKVLAEEGDIVFNTQDSLSKYNRIATAISNGDKTTLRKEKNKLPEDKGSKNQTGNKGVKRDVAMQAEEDALNNGAVNPNSRRKTSTKPVTRSSNYDFSKDYITRFGDALLRNTRYSAKYNPTTNKSEIIDKAATNKPSTSTTTPTTKSNEVFNDGYKLPSQNGYVAPKKPANTAPKPTTSTQGKQVRKPVSVSQVLNTPSQVGKFTPGSTSDADLTDLKGSRSLDQVAESAKPFINANSSNKPISSSSQTTSQITDTPTSKGMNGINTALQFTGVANNLFQGLKNEKGVDETYINPQVIKYNDRSQTLRNQSNQSMNAQISNARSLSGGNIGNLRANSTSARLANLDRQGSIDEREQGRADAIQAQNIGIQNQATEANAQRKDRYQEIGYANRAAKQSYIDQAASDIGQYGMAKQEEGYLRNRDRLAGEAQMAGYKSINGRYQHKSNLDGSTYFEPEADTSITKYGTSGGNRKSRTKTSIFAKGTKSVSTKYKLKSVV